MQSFVRILGKLYGKKAAIMLPLLFKRTHAFNMSLSISSRLIAVQARIAAAEAAAGRPRGSVRLIAVSKTQPAAMVRSAIAAGQLDFGENYLQEALEKQRQLEDLQNLIWHFIGPLQSNKTRAISEHFDWVHSIDRLTLAERLARQRPRERGPLKVCLQVNISREKTKSGVLPEAVFELAQAVHGLPGLELRGLMAIPEPCLPGEMTPEPFERLRDLLLQIPLPHLDVLSMGMSDDLDVAIAAGATHVRIGTAIFGARKASV